MSMTAQEREEEQAARVDFRLTLDGPLADRFHKYIHDKYGDQKRSMALVVRLALKEYLDSEQLEAEDAEAYRKMVAAAS